MKRKLNNEFLCNNLESRLVSLRKQKGETQGKVAEAIGVDVKTYAKYETGRIIPPTDRIIDLAEHFGTTTDYLLLGNKLSASQSASQLLDTYPLEVQEKALSVLRHTLSLLAQ